MSFLNVVADKSTGSIMVGNPGLAALSLETLENARTSLPRIKKRAERRIHMKTRPGVTGELLAPIVKMKKVLSTLYPENKNFIEYAWLESYANLADAFEENLPGYEHGLQAIQNAGVKALGSVLDSFKARVAKIQGVTEEQIAVLLDSTSSDLAMANNLMRDVCAKAHGNAFVSVHGSYSAVVSSLIAAVTELPVVEVSAAPEEAPISEGDEVTQLNGTDNIHQEVYLYIEGVEVPWMGMSVSSAIGALPQATIEIPPQAGLMDIARFYQPKVHIFYRDHNYGGQRLLFFGHIVAPNFSKSRQAGRASISFSCLHKNALLEGLTLEYSGYVNNPNMRNNNPEQAAIKVKNLNSVNSIVLALQGLTGPQSNPADELSATNTAIANADVTKLSPRFEEFAKRYEGIPSAMMNFWNQLKRDSYVDAAYNSIMTKMYIPLLEDGVKFFDRLTGHYILEHMVEEGKTDYCPGGASPEATQNKVMIAPCFKLNSISAIESSLMVQNLNNMLSASGEFTTFLQMFTQFLYSIEYEILTLASPAEVSKDPTEATNADSLKDWANVPKMAVETIIKPQIPFYFSPLCNLLLPRMYDTISVAQEEASVPTRITVFHDAIPGSQGTLSSSYRAPASIREAIAVGIGAVNSATASSIAINLQNTTDGSYNIPGKYEQGRGIRHTKMAMPQWLAQMVKGKVEEIGDFASESWPSKGTPEYTDMMKLSAAWTYRYGYKLNATGETVRDATKDMLNPFSPKAKIHPSQRLLFSSADYEYTKSVAQSRSGSVEALFNPYIVVGYPMDIVDSSPNHPSFHALCTSVTHSMASNFIRTSIGFAAATTYTELSNYYMTPLHPWMTTALDMINVEYSEGGDYGDIAEVSKCAATLINNPLAKAKADQFYRDVLGVGAVAVDEVFSFQSGMPLPVTRVNGILGGGSVSHAPQDNGGEGNPYLTSLGNLAIISRPIEGKKALESRFGFKFIDMTPLLYNGSQAQYMPIQLSSDRFLEPGASLFLDYTETEEFIK